MERIVHGRSTTSHTKTTVPITGTVRIWDVSADGPMLLHSLPHPVVLTVLAISPDQHRLAAADLRDIQLYDLTHFPPVKVASLGPHDSRIASLSFSPDSKILLSGSIRGITMWDVETDQELQHRRVGADVHAAEIISSGRQLGFLIGSHLEASPRGGRVSMQWIDQQEVDDYWMNRQAAISTTDD